jgi:hypothetical protein
LTILVEESLADGPVRIPTKVRQRDIDAALDSLSDRVVMVVIEDEGTPDWVPEPLSAISQEEALPKNEEEAGPSQAEIDLVVEDLLRNGDDPESRQ